MRITKNDLGRRVELCSGEKGNIYRVTSGLFPYWVRFDDGSVATYTSKGFILTGKAPCINNIKCFLKPKKTNIENTLNDIKKGTVHNFKHGGFVELVDFMGNDLTTVNAARVSMGKRKEKFDDNDAKLVKYLVDNSHGSPMRHAQVQLHVKCSEMVARQLWKHCIGGTFSFQGQVAFNEISGRYVEYQNEFWLPGTLRKKAEKAKQGCSSDNIHPDTQRGLLAKMKFHQTESYDLYKELLACGVCNEQARSVLPVSFFTEFYWTMSLQGFANFVKLRQDKHAQKEIQEYAEVVDKFLKELYPVTWKELMKG